MDTYEAYLNYVEDWQLTHADPAFDGMSPVSYQEWLDNECQEGL